MSDTDQQHVGRLADAIDNGDGGAAGRLRRMTKPSGKAYRSDGHDLGDGDQCMDAEGVVTGHGRMYVGPIVGQYCPHQSHDSARAKEMQPHG